VVSDAFLPKQTGVLQIDPLYAELHVQLFGDEHNPFPEQAEELENP
jgi:hypothetical protein